MKSLRMAAIFVALGAIGLSQRSDVARAAWPPGPNDDLTNPANWPNDPGYAGTWQWQSFLPKQAANTAPYLDADKKLGAAGMSVDKAWTYTIGRPEVRISVIDSGIKWDEPELVNKAYLNALELRGAHLPKTALGQPCGGTGALAGYDCNADGVFSVADYRDDPRVSPVVAGDKCFTEGDPKQPGADRIKGDVNHNCILDAGDLIEMFSDGIDDDANGYVDDISGWDFFKNDNNAYDDTRYGHGTGEAKDSAGEGNNGDGGIGGCPLCRFLPMRVGDSFIANVNDFGKAVIYATDNGVSVVQEALGTLNQNAFSRAAIDYAYAHGVVVIASMADENSRHHNMPGTANHTLPVHAITHDGGTAETATTFLAFNTCTNFGGNLAMSISGPACSSEATGRGSGIAGLIYSMALSQPQPLRLSAEEVMQLFKASADDIDVLESHVKAVPDPTMPQKFYESKAGWDQRFGYGRANAARAMQMIKDGLIPPEVDIVTPDWFDTLYSDRSSGPVSIIGHVSATRAKSYDYKVEWAAGVEPDERDFRALTGEMRNVPAATVSGGSTTPLATIDPRQVDTAHPADPDSFNHENDRTITLRVRATAHYANGDVTGEARRTIAVVNDRNGVDGDLLPGFPIKLNGSAEASTKLADIDGDQVRDIVAATSAGELHVYSMKTGGPADIERFPFHTLPIDGLNAALTTEPTVPTYLNAPAYANGPAGGVDPSIARESITTAPAIGDLDGDGKPEIVIVTYEGTLYVIDHLANALPGWPKRLPLVPSCPLDPAKPKPAAPCMDTKHGFARGAFSSPVLIDMDKDGKPEIVQAAFDGNIYVFHADGTPLAGFPVLLHSPRTDKQNRIFTTPAVADFNGDGIPDLASGSNEEIGGGGGSGPAFVVDGRGNNAPGGPYLPNWPVTLVSLHLFPVVAEGIDSSPVIADVDGDNKPDVLFQGNGAPPYLLSADPGKQTGFSDPPNKLPVVTAEDGTVTRGFDPTSTFGEQTKAFRPDTMFPLFSQPSFADLDQDGTPDIIMSGGSLSLAGNLAGSSQPKPFQHLLAMWSGKTGHMLPGSPVVVEDYTFFVNHAVADITGDDYPEVITGTGSYFLRAVNGCGVEAEGWPKFTGGWIASTASVGDVNGDHALDVVVGTRDGNLYAWRTKGRDDGVVSWESIHHDNANTGDYRQKLGQGTIKRAAKPLECALPMPPTMDAFDAGGCAVAPIPGSSPWRALFAVGVAVGLALAFRARRRS
jgi:hypothetical protein